ncbi:beta-phosphoglucomutase [Vagococcus intermedius]|uniref:Beta-phosphoglucomutase n=1 Tax=Vagococcus intermedius TaxID=2991418 RepID=A0AAF0CWK6_9ENTE|nr:beta-phosphoglucomutase [Vagococcus intermedius]WEG74216.1 beta-phosphoglucomutase [Vagococcus intermedius]WEG76298.1 beta-phosphoglucomutase [Vagococcus intermedius]
MFKGVLFDLDGVITDTAEYHYQAWKLLAKELGITIDRDFNESLKGVSREDSLKLILNHGDQTNKYTLEECARLAEKKNHYYLSTIQSIGPKDVFPGILALLQELKAHQVKIGLASASKNGPFLLEKMALTSFFDTVADPAKVPFGKPAPDIFIAAAKGLNIQPEECIGIEDSKAGIQAIIKSRALPIGVGTTKELGANIPLVTKTDQLTYDYLHNTWNSHHD